MKKLFVGWDVGGWHCDKNKLSRDALVVLGATSGKPKVLGKPWRGNLRRLLTEASGPDLVRGVLKLCDVSASEDDEVVFAIDTPLGWPSAMLNLVLGGPSTAVTAQDGANPYTRRVTELELIRRGFSPLSAVRDMLGSQSTKGIHFLRVAGLQPISPGLWGSGEAPQRVTALETYPAVALRLGRLPELHALLLAHPPFAATANRDSGLNDDIRDALACALIALLFGESPQELAPIPDQVPEHEGWILLPLAAAASGRRGPDPS